MPWLQQVAERANMIFGRDNIKSIDLGALEPGTRLSELARRLDIADADPARADAEAAYLDGWPDGLQEAIRGALFSAVNRESRLPVTIAWSPGYDYEVTITESVGVDGSSGGMTIILRSRYPGDRMARR